MASTKSNPKAFTEHYDLDDDQVEALITAIEGSPIDINGGQTGELTIQAALYLTGDKPAERESDFVDALLQIEDAADLHNEKVAFQQILDDFETATEQETAPQVEQTKQRLRRIVFLLSEAKSNLQNAEQKTAKSLALDKKTPHTRDERSDRAPLASTQTGSKSANDSQLSLADDLPVAQTAITDTNWFRFAAFATVSVGIVLVVLALVYWLKKRNESDGKTNDADDVSAETDITKKDADKNANRDNAASVLI